ncbi:RagB/SusD family nutrient uptake outer membrane protein [Proteiniphilum sp.]|uniref:RagB/SusD family nutrient uptake outer membrane protein n=1 Tax=Proteiniphilum sp. TaxID=1926877 RepID=UPI002B211041|nr:RagB/SusD family nutrient uptake outer membrane protein [Proteiniphilum sp.]MEA4916713.1 RagB/SusD family nutrient uptake outer membrane protein [Proteiniphilum sp.]
MKKLIYLIATILFNGVMVSCNYLDVVPDNVATIEYAFRNRTSTEKFLYTCYGYLPREGDVLWDVAMGGGDDTWTHSFIGWSARNIANARQNSTNPYINFWNGGQGADVNLWQGIRDCNIFLENINSVIDIPEYEKIRWAAEVKFLKAYYHFYLFRMYGPIPIVDVNLPVSAGIDAVKVYREPVDSVVNYITDLMLEASKELPPEKDVIEGTEAGRMNNLIAMSVRAQVFIFAASPLFNGNTNYASIVDNRGIHLFPQTYDGNKWKIAADACKEAIEMCHNQGKALYDLVDPQAMTAPEPFWIQTTYRQAICDRWNKELIWGGTNVDCASLSRQAQAKIMRLAAEHTSIRSEWGPTIKMVESYYSKNGVPISEDIEWIDNEWYDQRFRMRPEPSSGDEKYYIKEGQKTIYLHYNREPRFYASLGFDRGIYFGNGYYDFPDNVKWTEFMAKEFSGMSSASECFSITGYSVKKMHSFKNAVTNSTNSVEYYPFPVMRLADLYLYYAEALNEASGPSDEVFFYLDAIRARGGLEGVKQSWDTYSVNPSKPDTKEGLREIIQAERNIELAFEGKRFWDIRRWKQISTYNVQPQGWNAIGDNPEDFYRLTNLPQKPIKFSVKDYFWPIREYDLSVNKNLIQNYGW